MLSPPNPPDTGVYRGAGLAPRPHPEFCRHSPAAMAGWTAPRAAWSGCCGSPTGVPGPAQGAEAQQGGLGVHRAPTGTTAFLRPGTLPLSPQTPPQPCPTQAPSATQVQSTLAPFLFHRPSLFLYTSRDRVLIPSLPVLLVTGNVLHRLCPPGQPHPPGPSSACPKPLTSFCRDANSSGR